MITKITSKFKRWKTIKLGTGLCTANDFRHALKNGGCRIGNLGNDILGKPAFIASETETEVDLVVVEVEELGFEGATRADIYKRVQELGLEICPAEVGPQLRLQYNDQPSDGCLTIGMEPIAGSDGSLRVFDVAHTDDGFWLLGNSGDPDYFWSGYSQWVFLRRK